MYLGDMVSNPEMRLFSCKENGEITGFAVNRVQDSSTMELAGIIVREDLLGKGIGSVLLSKCIESARDAGFTKMVAKTETSNERVISFHMKKGFLRVRDTVETVENSRVELTLLKLPL